MTSGILHTSSQMLYNFVKLYSISNSYYRQQEFKRSFYFKSCSNFSVTTSRNLSVVEAQKAQLEL